METVHTSYGEVPLAEIVRQYERLKAHNEKSNQKRREHIQTEEGKLKNRERSKAYYEKHREEVLEKRAKAYDPKRKRHPNKKKDESG